MKTVNLRKQYTTPFKQQPERFVNTQPVMPTTPVAPVSVPTTTQQPVQPVEPTENTDTVVNNNVKTGMQNNINTQSNPTAVNVPAPKESLTNKKMT
ncbi:MAG: hypothetical protein Unbinned1524contig1000_11 [Prokaryotic dsDNA virus sp.]|nr:MAG: hypothetical protein Unbinned1524contig1000_11 [Prokaryotic dsDNA virus sp.]|tara:strand:- start:5036 stop:5323 length:288 start_codon:yes stop_codon:yes gene_type:complete